MSSAFVENAKKFVKDIIMAEISQNKDEYNIKIPSSFTKHKMWDENSEERLKRCVLRGICDNIPGYAKVYYISASNGYIVITKKGKPKSTYIKKSNNHAKSLEDHMIEFVNHVIENIDNEYHVINNPILLKRPDKFFGFFIKVLCNINKSIQENYQFHPMMEENKIRIISEERINIEFNEFMSTIVSDLTSVLKDTTKYNEFNDTEYQIPNLIADRKLKKKFLTYISVKHNDLKNKFIFDFEYSGVIKVKFNYCLKLFCNKINCSRCHKHHYNGLFSDFFYVLNSYKKDNNNCYLKKVYDYSSFNESKIEFIDSDDESKYQKEKELQNLGKDYDKEYVKNKEKDAYEPIYHYFTLVHEKYFDESKLVFKDDEEKSYYEDQIINQENSLKYDSKYLDDKMRKCMVYNIYNDNHSMDTLYSFDMSDSIFDYCFKICEENIMMEKKKFIDNHIDIFEHEYNYTQKKVDDLLKILIKHFNYENLNKNVDELTKVENSSKINDIKNLLNVVCLEDMISKEIDNKYVDFRVSSIDRCFQIKFTRFSKFKKKLEKICQDKVNNNDFPTLIPREKRITDSSSITSGDSSVWFMRNRKITKDNEWIKIDGKWVYHKYDIEKEQEEVQPESDSTLNTENKGNKITLRNLSTPSSLTAGDSYCSIPTPRCVTPRCLSPTCPEIIDLFTNENDINFSDDEDDYDDYDDEEDYFYDDNQEFLTF